jgi:hypothetical protein
VSVTAAAAAAASVAAYMPAAGATIELWRTGMPCMPYTPRNALLTTVIQCMHVA